MAYRPFQVSGLSGFLGRYKALVETWGLENDQRGTYQLSLTSSGQPLMIEDPVTANK